MNVTKKDVEKLIQKGAGVPSEELCKDGWSRHLWNESTTIEHDGERYVVYKCQYCPTMLLDFQ